MSLHPSLKTDVGAGQQRSVLSRIERIKDLMKKGLWQENQRTTALPKTKVLKIKTKKAKAKAEGAAAAPGAAAAAKSDAAKKPEAAKKSDAAKEKK